MTLIQSALFELVSQGIVSFFELVLMLVQLIQNPLVVNNMIPVMMRMKMMIVMMHSSIRGYKNITEKTEVRNMEEYPKGSPCQAWAVNTDSFIAN